jgi:ATP-binding cassette subfamily F protein 3
LDQFEGTLIFISHDVYFIRALANHVVHVNAGQLTHYPGGYQYYLDKTKAASERAALTASVSQSASSATQKGKSAQPLFVNQQAARKEQKRLEAEQRQARSRERKAQQQVVHELEKEIQQLERAQAELIAQLEKQETYETPGYAQKINRELVAIQQQLAELNPKWEAAATKLAAQEQASVP